MFNEYFELGMFLIKWDESNEDVDEFEEKLCEKYGIDSLESFDKLIKDLLPLCGESMSPFSNTKYAGFVDRQQGTFLESVDVND